MLRVPTLFSKKKNTQTLLCVVLTIDGIRWNEEWGEVSFIKWCIICTSEGVYNFSEIIIIWITLYFYYIFWTLEINYEPTKL